MEMEPEGGRVRDRTQGRVPRIYFAGSIRGGRRDRDLYAGIIEFLGDRATVLTEHVGDLEVQERAEKDLTDGQIFERDLAWLKKADALVAEVTQPSLGVGYEIALAEARGLPVFCLFRPRPGLRLSAMIRGNRHVTVVEYRDMVEARSLLEAFLESCLETPPGGGRAPGPTGGSSSD